MENLKGKYWSFEWNAWDAFSAYLNRNYVSWFQNYFMNEEYFKNCSFYFYFLRFYLSEDSSDINLDFPKVSLM